MWTNRIGVGETCARIETSFTGLRREKKAPPCRLQSRGESLRKERRSKDSHLCRTFFFFLFFFFTPRESWKGAGYTKFKQDLREWSWNLLFHPTFHFPESTSVHFPPPPFRVGSTELKIYQIRNTFLNYLSISMRVLSSRGESKTIISALMEVVQFEQHTKYENKLTAV